MFASNGDDRLPSGEVEGGYVGEGGLGNLGDADTWNIVETTSGGRGGLLFDSPFAAGSLWHIVVISGDG